MVVNSTLIKDDRRTLAIKELSRLLKDKKYNFDKECVNNLVKQFDQNVPSGTTTYPCKNIKFKAHYVWYSFKERKFFIFAEDCYGYSYPDPKYLSFDLLMIGKLDIDRKRINKGFVELYEIKDYTLFVKDEELVEEYVQKLLITFITKQLKELSQKLLLENSTFYSELNEERTLVPLKAIYNLSGTSVRYLYNTPLILMTKEERESVYNLLIKKNININENVAVEKDDLFSDDILKGENQKILSLETFDGKENSEKLEGENGFTGGNLEKNDEKRESAGISESLSSGNFFNDEKENSNKKNGSSLDEIWKKMNGNLNEIVENNVENLQNVENSNLVKSDKDKRNWDEKSNFRNYEKFSGEKNSNGINENTENEYYKVGTFEKFEGEKVVYDILGQIFDTYILVKRNDELEIYDQHIIHERILYEELKEKFYGKKIDSIQLLIPKKMEVTSIEKEIIFENIEIFNNFGFEIDEFYENEILIRAVPVFDFRESCENVFEKLLNDLKNEVEIKDLREKIIISMSCRGAVKAGQKLSFDEMQNMVRRIHEVGKYTCPHGRPIIVKLTKNDLDKMFGRRK